VPFDFGLGISDWGLEISDAGFDVEGFRISGLEFVLRTLGSFDPEKSTD